MAEDSVDVPLWGDDGMIFVDGEELISGPGAQVSASPGSTDLGMIARIAACQGFEPGDECLVRLA